MQLLIILSFLVFLLLGIGIRRSFILGKAKKRYHEFHKKQVEVMGGLEQRRERSLASLETEMRQSKHGLEKELRHKNQEQKQLQGRIQNKEKTLEQKKEKLKTLLEQVEAKAKELEEEKHLSADVNQKWQEFANGEDQRLEQQAHVSSEQIRAETLKKIEEQVDQECRQVQQTQQKENQQRAEREATKILETAIQRLDFSHFSDGGVVSVPLPNEEMKGRIIGKEGRNIQTLELLTGTEFVLDQVPGQILIQSTDAVRREVGRRVLEILIAEGRINPVRIEEVVRKIKADVEEIIQEAGEEILLELGIHEVHPDLIRLLGRLKFTYSSGQNVLQHIKETAYITEMLAAELGENSELAKRAGLFHDIGKSISKDVSTDYDTVGVEITKRYGEDPVLVNAVGAVNGRQKADSLLADLIAASNQISSYRPGACSEKNQNFMNRSETIEKVANSFAGVDRSYCLSGGREVRVFVDSKKINEAGVNDLARQVSKKIKGHRDISGEVKVVLIRETRIVEIAK